MDKISKQVIIVRKDLNMRKGKMVAQGAHASLNAVLQIKGHAYVNPDFVTLLDAWLASGYTKICVGVSSERALEVCYNAASGLPRSLIVDEGRTEFNNVPTKTCVAIGPALGETIDLITGGLKLL